MTTEMTSEVTTRVAIEAAIETDARTILGPEPGTESDAVALTCFEPCDEHRGSHVDGPCERCGWLGSDHGLVDEGLGAVLRVPDRPARPLRRAS